jgi:NAD(P)-dependent dehydrogenase (short-subunit alcohol dehydrogenase family)
MNPATQPATTATDPPPIVLITGGAGCLATAIRLELESNGWQVLAPDRSQLDVTDQNSIDLFFAPLTRLDLLINQAGIIRDASLLTMSHEQFDQVLQVNLNGAFRCSRAALQLMSKQRRGQLIHISSWSALHGPIGQANYAAAKAGLIGLSKSIAKEYGQRNIRSNCILPGFLESPMTAHLLADDTQRRAIQQQHSLRSLNTPQHAARFIHMLTQQPHISGQVFQLDSRI